MTHKQECDSFVAWAARVGDDVATDWLERICDAFCQVCAKGHGEAHGVRIRDIHQHNACNHTISGSFVHEREELYFIIDNGDWGGTVVKQFGTIDEVGVYEPPKPTRRTFVPADPLLEVLRPELYRVYLAWKKQPWFVEQVGKMNYDFHFAPGEVTRKHYTEWAAKRGLAIGFEDDE